MLTLVLVALEDELPGDLDSSIIKVVTGVGKVNAAIATVNAIHEYNPSQVINFGTAGTLNPVDYPTGLYEVGAVMERDMDCRALGCDLGQTLGEDEVVLNLGVEYGPSLSTGDNFVSGAQEMVVDLVDMEAYAIVKACSEMNVPIRVFKYVSDNADSEASDTWQKNKNNGIDLFLEKLKEIS